MKPHSLGILVLTAAVAATAWAQDKPPASPNPPATAPGLVPLAVQLEQGIYQEQTAGQLEAAARTYSQIAAQAEATRLLAAQALYRLAVVQSKLKQTTEAQATLQRLAAQYPEQHDLIAKAQAAVPGAADAGVARAGGNGTPGDSNDWERRKKEMDQLVVKGWQLMQEGKFRDAADAFAKASSIDNTAASLAGQGWADLYVPHDDKTPYKAESYFKLALTLNPRDAMALSGLGEYYASYDRNGDLIRGQDYWKAAVEADPTATRPMARLAASMAGQGLYEEAASWYERWLKQEPQTAPAKQGLTKVQQTQAAIKAPMAVVEEYLKKLDGGAYREAYDTMDIPVERPAPTMWGRGPIASGRRGAAGVEPVPATAPAINPEVAAEMAAKEWVDRIRAQREPLGKVLTRKVGNTTLGMAVPESLNDPYTYNTGVGGGGPGGGGYGGGGGGGGGFGGSGAFDQMLRSSLIGDEVGSFLTRSGPINKPLTLTSDALSEVRVTYGTSFEHQKGVTETILLRKDANGRWRIARYELDANWHGVDPLKAQ